MPILYFRRLDGLDDNILGEVLVVLSPTEYKVKTHDPRERLCFVRWDAGESKWVEFTRFADGTEL